MIFHRALTVTFAMSLALYAGAAMGGSVTYDFIEETGSPNPGMLGGLLTFSSPPAFPNSFWTTSSGADILGFQITDPAIGPVGSYLSGLEFIVPIASSDGTSLTQGDLVGINSGVAKAEAFMNPGFDNSMLNSTLLTGFGQWVLASSVPEPSTLVLAGCAAAAGLGVWARRRRAR
jgi:PEP-CTERM motif